MDGAGIFERACRHGAPCLLDRDVANSEDL